MEGQTQFQTALKKTVIMFKTITGKDLSEREASLLINLLDLTDGYLSANAPKDDNSEAKALVKLVDEVLVGGLTLSGTQCLVNHGTAGMVVSVGEAGNISAAPVTAEQIYSVKESEPSGSSCNAVGAENCQHRAPITTSERDHIQGYDWQIVVLSREKDPRDSYVAHFAYQPTQEQFEEHFAKYVARTHYVHVNEWRGGAHEWQGITHRYAGTGRVEKDHDPRWEQADIAYRVRYYDRETGQLTFKYMPRKPSGSELATYHHIKGFAVVQSKVA